jgi:hypothetical protein
MIQTAHMDCAKDRCDLLEQTIVPKLDEHVRAMQNSSVIVVDDETNLEQRKSYLVLNNIEMNSIMFTPENKLVCRIEGSEEQVEVDVDLWEDSSCHKPILRHQLQVILPTASATTAEWMTPPPTPHRCHA